MQNDPALVAFEKLKVREVRAEGGQTAAVFLAQFQSTAASLQPNERIKLVVLMRDDVELIKAVLADPQANRIYSLKWWYDGKEDVSTVLPLLISSCPELASLRAEFGNHSSFDFVSSVLEHPSNKIKVLEMPLCTEGDFARFFAALGQSKVSAITLSIGDSPEFARGLHEYLARDVLVRLDLWENYKRVPFEMMSLVKCTRLAELELAECNFSQSHAFTLPKSVTKLTLDDCTFVDGVDWSSLADSNVRELDLHHVRGVDGKQLGSALAVHLRAKGLDKLCFYSCYFVNETLAVIGVELGRIKRLEITSSVNDASVELIALALKSPNSELRELVLLYGDNTASSVEDHLVPVLKHPNCNLVKLSFRAFGSEHEEAAKRVEDMFYNRLALFVLLQGRQVRRRSPCPLRRLPVEMFRLVGAALI